MAAQVAVIDDHPIFREGLLVALGREPDLEIVGEAGDASAAIELARRTSFDLAVIDVLMPKTSGMSLVSQLHEMQPACKILGLSVVDEPLVIANMFRAGASGYALKWQTPDEIVAAVRAVLSGQRYLAPSIARDAVDQHVQVAPDKPIERLTPREREVFDLLIRGYTNEQISGHLSIARRTVETHRLRIMNKLPARSVVEMIRVAARYGAVE